MLWRVAHSQDAQMNAELMQRFPDAAYIDATARVHGKVEIGEGASLWP